MKGKAHTDGAIAGYQSAPQPRAIAVVIDSNHDTATCAVYAYRECHVYPKLASHGIALKKLQGDDACRDRVAEEMVKPGIGYVTGSGHGCSTQFQGQQNRPVIEIDNFAPAEAADKVIHFLSCNTAQILGPDLVANRCRAFFGYEVYFTFTTEHKDVFFECDAEIDLAFAEGLTAQEVYQRVKLFFEDRIDVLRNRCGAIYSADTLANNLAHLCCPTSDPKFGDKGAKLF